MAEITLRAFIKKYLVHCELYNTQGTVANKLTYAQHFINYFRNVKLQKIGRPEIEGYIRTRKRTAGNPTINRELSMLKNLFYYAIEMGLIETNPVKGIRYLPEPRKPLNIPSKEDVTTWLLYCLQHDTLLYDLSVIAVNTGLRRGDILKIRGEDIDLARRQLAVAISKTRGEHYIPLNEDVFRVLKRRKRPGFIFTNGNGDHVKGFKRRWRNAKQGSGFEFRFRDFRDFFATEILTNGTDIRTVQDLMAHARITTTERYLAVTDKGRRKAVDTLKWSIPEGYTLFKM